MPRLLRTLALAPILAFLIANSAASAQQVATLQIAEVSKTAGEWATYVATELGYFKRYNVDPQPVVVGSASATVQQLLAGAADVAESSPTQVVESITNGAQVHDICERMTSAPRNAMPHCSPAGSPPRSSSHRSTAGPPSKGIRCWARFRRCCRSSTSSAGS